MEVLETVAQRMCLELEQEGLGKKSEEPLLWCVHGLATFISLVGCGQEFAADFAQKVHKVIRFTKKITNAAKVNQIAAKVKKLGQDTIKSN